MTRSLIPWKRNKANVEVQRAGDNPFADLHRRMDELFDDFFSDMGGVFQLTGQQPRTPRLFGREGSKGLMNIDVAETDSEVTVTADLPGLTEKDVEVTLDEDLLTIRGSRKEEREDKTKNYHLVERSYGEFQRMVALPGSIDRDKAKATFKNGVLTLTIPKRADARSNQRRIEIEAA